MLSEQLKSFLYSDSVFQLGSNGDRQVPYIWFLRIRPCLCFWDLMLILKIHVNPIMLGMQHKKCWGPWLWWLSVIFFLSGYSALIRVTEDWRHWRVMKLKLKLEASKSDYRKKRNYSFTTLTSADGFLFWRHLVKGLVLASLHLVWFCLVSVKVFNCCCCLEFGNVELLGHFVPSTPCMNKYVVFFPSLVIDPFLLPLPIYYFLMLIPSNWSYGWDYVPFIFLVDSLLHCILVWSIYNLTWVNGRLSHHSSRTGGVCWWVALPVVPNTLSFSVLPPLPPF